MPEPIDPSDLETALRVLKQAGSYDNDDPDFIALPALLKKAGAAGFVCERCVGPRWAYTAVFRPAAALQE